MTVTAEIAALSPTFHLRLAEASGTDAADEEGVHGGTYVWTPTLGVAGYAADGTGITLTRTAGDCEGVQVPDHADLDWGTSDVSLFLAVKMASWYATDWQGFFTKGSGNPFLVGTQTTTNRLGIFIVDTAYNLDISTNIANDAWHALLFTLDRSGLASVFVDGGTTAEATADISAKVASDLQGANDVYIGSGGTSYPMGGSLQHVAFWKGILITGSQFATIHAARTDAGSTPQVLKPDADTDAGGWATTPLWSKVDDDPASPDATVISATSS